MPFPRFTWFRCECGCGYEGECELAQWLIEDAMTHGLNILDHFERRGLERKQALQAAEKAVADRLEQKRKQDR